MYFWFFVNVERADNGLTFTRLGAAYSTLQPHSTPCINKSVLLL